MAIECHRRDGHCVSVVLTIANPLGVCKLERNSPQKVSYFIIIHYRISWTFSCLWEMHCPVWHSTGVKISLISDLMTTKLFISAQSVACPRRPWSLTRSLRHLSCWLSWCLEAQRWWAAVYGTPWCHIQKCFYFITMFRTLSPSCPLREMLPFLPRAAEYCG